MSSSARPASLVLVICAALIACNRFQRTLESAAPEGARATTAPSPSPVPTHSEPATLIRSAASFDGDKLVACSDVTFPREPLEAMARALNAKSKDAGALTAQALLDDEVRVFLLGGQAVVTELLDK